MFLPIGTYLLITMYAHVLATHNVFGAISLFEIIDLCTFSKALPGKSLWIKVSAKCTNVNVVEYNVHKNTSL